METDTDDTLRITIRVNRALVKELQEHCRETELKNSQVVRLALKRYLEEVRSSKAKARMPVR